MKRKGHTDIYACVCRNISGRINHTLLIVVSSRETHFPKHTLELKRKMFLATHMFYVYSNNKRDRNSSPGTSLRLRKSIHLLLLIFPQLWKEEFE